MFTNLKWLILVLIATFNGFNLCFLSLLHQSNISLLQLWTKITICRWRRAGSWSLEKMYPLVLSIYQMLRLLEWECPLTFMVLQSASIANTHMPGQTTTQSFSHCGNFSSCPVRATLPSDSTPDSASSSLTCHPKRSLTLLEVQRTSQPQPQASWDPAVQLTQSAGTQSSWMCAKSTRSSEMWAFRCNILFQSTFFQFDEDSSGAMSPFELSAALEAVGICTVHTHTHARQQWLAIHASQPPSTLPLPTGMQCDGKIVQLLSERFASGELHMPFHSFVSCVTRLRKLFGNAHTDSRKHKPIGPAASHNGTNVWKLQGVESWFACTKMKKKLTRKQLVTVSPLLLSSVWIREQPGSERQRNQHCESRHTFDFFLLLWFAPKWT